MSRTFIQDIITSELSKFGVGQPLPGERYLCELIGVARPAIRETLERLNGKGLVSRQHGKPTVITRDFFESEEHF